MDSFDRQKQEYMKKKLLEPNSYQKCYVAFLDLLGFKELCNKQLGCAEIKAIFDDIGLLKYSYDNTLSIVTISEKTRSELTFTVMSDSIVISAPKNDEGFVFILYLCSLIQNMLLKSQNMILLRGGIAEGEFFKLENLTFGPALIEAYKLENEVAFYPRVIIDRNIIDDLKQREVMRNERKTAKNAMSKYTVVDYRKHSDNYSSHISLFVTESKDDKQYFVDYLNSLELLCLSQQNGKIEFIKNGIVKGCRDENDRHRKKYEWLLKYYNEKMSNNYFPDMRKYVIELESKNDE